MNPRQIATESAELLAQRYGSEGNTRETILSPFGGSPENWVNYVPSRLEDENTTNLSDMTRWFLNQDDKVLAVCKVATAAIEGWKNSYPENAEPLDNWSIQQIYDFTSVIAARYVKGCIGEVFWSNQLNAEILDERKEDESNGIDIRTTENTYQIKTVSQFGNENVKKENADYTIIVKIQENGEVTDYRKYKN